MLVIDALKALGYDHIADTSFEKFNDKLDALCRQGLRRQMETQIRSLADCRIFDGEIDLERQDERKAFYRSFFKFWRKAVARLHDESTFTFEDRSLGCWTSLRRRR